VELLTAWEDYPQRSLLALRCTRTRRPYVYTYNVVQYVYRVVVIVVLPGWIDMYCTCTCTCTTSVLYFYYNCSVFLWRYVVELSLMYSTCTCTVHVLWYPTYGSTKVLSYFRKYTRTRVLYVYRYDAVFYVLHSTTYV
jgi:hypothetical protein